VGNFPGAGPCKKDGISPSDRFLPAKPDPPQLPPSFEGRKKLI